MNWSHGGTAQAIGIGLPVRDVSELTGFPEMMDGRVSAHRRSHGGLLAIRDDPSTRLDAAHGIAPIDLLVVNLYPFEATVGRARRSTTASRHRHRSRRMSEAPAKNTMMSRWSSTRTITPDLAELAALGGTSLPCENRWRKKAYARTAAMMRQSPTGSQTSSAKRTPQGPSRQARRGAALTARTRIKTRRSIARRKSAYGRRPARQVQGKQRSYNNINDTDAAYDASRNFRGAAPACVNRQAREPVRRRGGVTWSRTQGTRLHRTSPSGAS